jgi:hypothetical protein
MTWGISGQKKSGRGWKTWHDEQLHSSHSSLNIIREIRKKYELDGYVKIVTMLKVLLKF